MKFYEKYQICSKFPGKVRLWRFFFQSRCLSKFSKLLILVKTLNKKSILVKILENLNLDQVIENFDFCQKKLLITILIKILKKSCLITKFLKNLNFGQNFRNFEKS